MVMILSLVDPGFYAEAIYALKFSDIIGHEGGRHAQCMGGYHGVQRAYRRTLGFQLIADVAIASGGFGIKRQAFKLIQKVFKFCPVG